MVSADGRVHDERRVAYLREHFRRAAQAIQDGVPLRGYFVWSLMDNFEWAHGYSQRFGIVRVEYETGQRILKDSAGYYQSVIQANGVSNQPDADALKRAQRRRASLGMGQPRRVLRSGAMLPLWATPSFSNHRPLRARPFLYARPERGSTMRTKSAKVL